MSKSLACRQTFSFVLRTGCDGSAELTQSTQYLPQGFNKIYFENLQFLKKYDT